MLNLYPPAAFPANVCSDISIRVAATRSARQAAFELVYKSYLRSGLCAENEHGIRFTPYQLLPTTDIFIAELRGEVISTLSLVRDGELGLPMEDIYSAEVAARRAAGQRLAEVSCLADRRQDPGRFFELFRDMSRLMAQLARATGVDELLVTVHPRHAPLYRRYMAFTPLGELRDYPSVNGNPAVALSLNFARAQADSSSRWHEFFGDPLPDDVLQSRPITPADRNHFASIANQIAQGYAPLLEVNSSDEQRAGLNLVCA